MNFTAEIKKEIISKGIKKPTPCISAYVKTSGTIGVRDGKPAFFLVSETENVAEFFMTAFIEALDAELYITNATWDRMSGRDKLLLQCPAAKAEQVMQTLGLLTKTGKIREGISGTLVATEADKIAYIKGAFLGSGSCIIPSESGKTGYHLEWVFTDRQAARDFCDILDEVELIARLTERKETSVVYIKNKEQISDFLSAIGVTHALKKFSALVEKRDDANRSNRARNCIAGNADKTAIAAVKQVVALQKLVERGILDDLSPELKDLALTRLKNPSMTLQELADYFKVSKSCLNHRMRRLMSLSADIDKAENQEEK